MRNTKEKTPELPLWGNHQIDSVRKKSMNIYIMPQAADLFNHSIGG